jgi:hypothetical protein
VHGLCTNILGYQGWQVSVNVVTKVLQPGTLHALQLYLCSRVSEVHAWVVLMTLLSYLHITILPNPNDSLVS